MLFNNTKKGRQIFRLATVSTSIGSLKNWEVMMIYVMYHTAQ